MTEWVTSFVRFWDGIVLYYFIGLNLFYGVLFLSSVGETWRNWLLASRLHVAERFNREALPPISIIIPAHDEEEAIGDTVRAQLNLDYPHHEVIVVNDGSTDATFEVLQEEFSLYQVPPAFPRKISTEMVWGYYRSEEWPGLLVIDKANGGKSDALNAGVNAARFPLCASVDADTIIARDALPRVVRPFLLEEGVAGSGGTIRVANDCRIVDGVAVEPRVPEKFLAGVQVPEYLRAFLFGRLGWNRLGGNILVSGAFALYDRQLLLEAGGYPVESVTEDLSLTVSLHRSLKEEGRDYSLPFVPDPVAWTEVPEDLKSLGNQRERWHLGLIHTILDNLKMVFNPRYGGIGMVALPFFLLGEMLAPVVEILGYVVVVLGLAFGVLSWQFAALFFAIALGYMMLLSVWAVMLEEFTYRVYPSRRDFYRLLFFAVAEPFGYRQITVWWRLRAFFRALVGDREWGEHDRRGLRNHRLGETGTHVREETDDAPGADAPASGPAR